MRNLMLRALGAFLIVELLIAAFWFIDCWLALRFYFSLWHAAPAEITAALFSRLPAPMFVAMPFAAVLATVASSERQSVPLGVTLRSACIFGSLAAVVCFLGMELLAPASEQNGTYLLSRIMFHSDTIPRQPHGIIKSNISGDMFYVVTAPQRGRFDRILVLRGTRTAKPVVIDGSAQLAGGQLRISSLGRTQNIALPADVDAEILARPTEAIKWWQPSRLIERTISDDRNHLSATEVAGARATIAQRVTLPFAVTIAAVFGWAVCVATHRSRSGRISLLIVGVVGYFCAFHAIGAAAEKGLLLPAVWIPNATFALVALGIGYAASRSQSLELSHV